VEELVGFVGSRGLLSRFDNRQLPSPRRERLDDEDDNLQEPISGMWRSKASSADPGGSEDAGQQSQPGYPTENLRQQGPQLRGDYDSEAVQFGQLGGQRGGRAFAGSLESLGNLRGRSLFLGRGIPARRRIGGSFWMVPIAASRAGVLRSATGLTTPEVEVFPGKHPAA
jgi:hypothetical protein